MKKSVEQMILNGLLDKYEKSNAFKTGLSGSRRILMKFYDNGVSDFAYYDIESSERREEVNQAVQGLKEAGLIFFEWMRGEQGHLIAKVWLNMERLANAYNCCNRKPKDDLLGEILEELLELNNKIKLDWARQYCLDSIAAIKDRKKLPPNVPGQSTDRRELFRTIWGLDAEGGKDLTLRVFSTKYLAHSKSFEQGSKARLVNILRKYLEYDDDSREEDLLRQIGLQRYPEQFEFCGSVQIKTIQGVTDFSSCLSGSSIFYPDLNRGQLTINGRVRQVLTIENRANYFDWIEKHQDAGTLTIYHGGQYSPSKKAFFQAINQSMSKGATWFHWGDIDYGGFSMLARLRREINQGIMPYQMDLPSLQKFESMANKVSADYALKLKSLTEKSELSDCWECLNYLAEHQIKLEQEVMLIDGLNAKDLF